MTPNQKYINKSILLALFDNVLPSKFLSSVLRDMIIIKNINYYMQFKPLNF